MDKSVDFFKKKIEEYLQERAAKDEVFAKTISKENKNIDDCIKYIIDEVKKSGRIAFNNDEIYSLAVHYYDEDDITVSGTINGVKIVSDGEYVLSEEEKENARKEAISSYQNEVISNYKTVVKPKAKKVEAPVLSLFEDETKE